MRALKQAVQVSIGFVIYIAWRVFSPERLRAAEEQLFASHDLSFLERQLLTFISFRTRAESVTASVNWAGGAGSRYHSHQDHRLTLDLVAADTFYRRPMLDQFADRAAAMLRTGASIVEVGCGAGGNLLYLRRRLTECRFHYLGLDINSDVISSNRQQHRYEDLAFEQRDCFTSELGVTGDLGVIFCAVLMYVQETDIRRLMGHAAGSNHGRILLGLSEPIGDPEASYSVPHHNMGRLHGYRRIFRDLKFEPLFEDFRREEGKLTQLYHAVLEYRG
jgi:SAM-dependent methyltransferase